MREKISRGILETMNLDMPQQRYRRFKRAWGTYYAHDNTTGNSISLKTRNRVEADQKIHAMNEAEREPALNLSLARVYMNASDPKLGTHTWQEVMEHIVSQRKDSTKARRKTANKDKGFDDMRRAKEFR